MKKTSGGFLEPSRGAEPAVDHLSKFDEFQYDKKDIITTDKYLKFSECLKTTIYKKTDVLYHNRPINWRGNFHTNIIPPIVRNLILGHSDFPITEKIVKLCRSANIKKIYCLNKDCSNSDVIPLPLGITNDCDDSPIHRIFGNLDIMVSVFKDNTTTKDYLCYMNFNVSNHPERDEVYHMFKNEKWVTKGNINNTFDGRTQFLMDVKRSKFVLCPRGNGIDTHRLWESLYMGSIPIIKKYTTHELLTDLPILFIDDWTEITEEYLKQKWDEMIVKKWNTEKLRVSYWLKLILQNDK